MNPDVMDHDVTQVVRIFLRVSISIWRTGRDLYDKLTLFYFSLQVVAHPSFSWFTPSPYLFQVSTLRFTRFIRPNAPLLQVQKEKKTTKRKRKERKRRYCISSRSAKDSQRKRGAIGLQYGSSRVILWYRADDTRVKPWRKR